MKKSFLLLCVALTVGAAMMASCKKDNGNNPSDPKDQYGLTIGTFVDMGGSVLWCSRNLDADTPFGNGDFYEFSTSREGQASDIDERLTGTWRVPTKEEAKELLKNQQRVTLNGVKGYLFTGSNGNTLFVPCAGKIANGKHIEDGTSAYFWTSSSLSSDRAYSADGEWENEKEMEVSSSTGPAFNKLTLRVVMDK